MTKINFYRQERADGGTRTGIEIDGGTVLGRFQPGNGDSDPALKWYIDVRCEGKQLPRGPEEVRNWFLANSEVICNGLIEMAEKVRAGIDWDSWPAIFNVSGTAHGVRIKIACSATRRHEAAEIATILDETAKRWEELLKSLRKIQPVRS